MCGRIAYVIDVVVIAAVFYLIDPLLRLIPAPRDLRIDLLFGLVGKCAVVVIIWAVLRFRGNNLAAIGLKRPRSWSMSILAGVLAAGILFVAIFLLERAGIRRDLSGFAWLKGNLELTLYQCGYVVVAAGFVEEFIFRGFLFQRLARLLGGARWSWVIACVFQGAAFGFMHAYQNPVGIVITGAIGCLMGALFLSFARNLWPPIIAHALYDVSRTLLFYFHGPPSI